MIQETLTTARRPYDGSSLYHETLELLEEIDRLGSPDELKKYVVALNTYLNYRGSRDRFPEVALGLNLATKDLCFWFLSEKVYESKEAAVAYLALTPPPCIMPMQAIS